MAGTRKTGFRRQYDQGAGTTADNEPEGADALGGQRGGQLGRSNGRMIASSTQGSAPPTPLRDVVLFRIDLNVCGIQSRVQSWMKWFQRPRTSARRRASEGRSEAVAER